jgi:hypothetical protein
MSRVQLPRPAPGAGLASPVWHRQGPAARYGRCRPVPWR